MKTKTPFYELAEKYAKNKERCHGVCDNLERIKPLKYYEFFHDVFYPSIEAQIEFKVFIPYWMESPYNTLDQNRYDRITALLFADLLWQEEMKGKKK